MTYIKYHPVNWIDGMRINKDHFIASENALSDKIHRAAGYSLNDINYGILPPFSGIESSLKITTEIDARDILHVRLNTCQAITRGGIFIDIHQASGDQASFNLPILEASVDLQNPQFDNYYLVLTVDPFKRVPAGEADPEENPPRNPFAIPEYKLNLIPPVNINTYQIGVHFLVIGHLKIVEKKAQLTDEYIPPCSQVRSHPALIDLHDRITNFLIMMEKNTLEVIGKIHLKRQKSTLSATVLDFNENLLVFLSHQVSEHKWILIHQPPVYMLESISRFSRLMMNLTESYPHEYKEEMINYYSDWCNLRQGEFEEMLTRALNAVYVHENIKETIIPLLKFMEVISFLYKTLSGLEYIGKPKELGVYIKEEIKTKRPLFTED
jgi:uncharacterized protein YbgA (DUF1722 family)